MVAPRATNWPFQNPVPPSVMPGLLAWISAEVKAGDFSMGWVSAWLNAALTKESNRLALTNDLVIFASLEPSLRLGNKLHRLLSCPTSSDHHTGTAGASRQHGTLNAKPLSYADAGFDDGESVSLGQHCADARIARKVP